MTERMLADVGQAHNLRSCILRYFNVAGADPKGRTGQSSATATHLIKVACQTALGRRAYLEVFGDDYPTADGTGVRDYIHVTDLVRAHVHAVDYLRKGGESITLNCGYERGYSVLEVIEAVKRVSGVDFDVRVTKRRPGDPAALVAATGRIRQALNWRPQFNDLDTIVEHVLRWEHRLDA